MQKLWTKNYILIMVVNFVTAMAYSAFVSTLPLFVKQIGSNNAVAGSMTAAMTFVIILAKPLSGFLCDRYGRKPILMIGSVLFTLNTFAYIFTTSLSYLFIVRVLHGVGIGLFTVSAATLVADIVPEERLVDGIGFYSTSSSLSTAIAPLTAMYVASHYGFTTLFIVMSITAVIGVVFSMLIHLKPVKKLESADGIRRKTGKSHIGFETSILLPAVVMLFLFLCNSAGNNFIPMYGIEKGIANISVYFMINGICMIMARFLAGKISKKLGYTQAVIGGFILVFSGYILLGFAGSLIPIILAGALNGFGSGIASPIVNAHVYTLCDPDRRGMAQATYGVFTFCGTGVGAILWGFVSEYTGLPVTFRLASISVVLAMLIYVTLLRPKLRAKLKSDALKAQIKWRLET